MKQNFLLKSFVLLIALLAGGISASWADGVTDLSFTATKTIAAGGEIWLTTSENVASANTVGWCSKNENASTNKYGNITPSLSGDISDDDPAYHSISGVLVKGGNTPSNLTTSKKALVFKVTNMSAITAYAATTSSSGSGYLRWYIYDTSDNSTVVDGVYGEGASSNSTCIISKDGLDPSKTYIVNIEGGYKNNTGSNQDCVLYAIKFASPDSGKNPSAFDLTSKTSVTLWKGETSAITYSDAAGTVTFESSDADVATVDADGVITAVSEGTAVITVTDPGSETVDGANKTINVTVKEHKNTTTESVAAATGKTAILDNSGTISDDTFTLSFKDYPMTIVGDQKFQVGSNNYKFTVGGTDYPAVKVSKNGTYVLKPQAGITITSVNVYASSNSNTESGISSGTNEAELAARGTSGTPVAPDAFALSKNDDGEFYFTITGSASQAIVVLEVTYDATQQMTLEIKETGYATLFTDYAVAIPEGVEAFTGKYNAETQTVQLSAVTGTIPANTAVILHTETPGTYSFVKADDVAAITNNDLLGTLEEKDVNPQSVYTLGLGGADNTVGMRLYNGTKIRPYSAYMEIPTATIAPTAPFLSIGFGEEGTTGIRSIDNGQLTIDNVYYDLAGRRVAQPSKGVYIVNGKKVVIK